MQRGMITLRVVALAAGLACVPSIAHAQESTVTPTDTSSTGKGIVGGALLGAEAVMLVEAAAGVEKAWPYIVGGSVGAIGGGVGGYFVEDSEPKLSLYLLAGGMTLIVPTTIAVLARTSYDPPADYTEDRPPADEPVAEPPQPVSSATPGDGSSDKQRAARTQAEAKPKAAKRTVQKVAAKPPPALVDVDEGLLSLSVPAIEVRDVYTQKEMSIYGVKQQTEVRVPVLNVIF